MEIFCCPGVHVEGVSISFSGLSQDDPNQIMRAPLIVLCLHFRRDLVIGLGEHVLQFHLVRIVAKRFEWNDFSHFQLGLLHSINCERITCFQLAII